MTEGQRNRSAAVSAQRFSPVDTLDFWPTLPWASRALCEWLQRPVGRPEETGGFDLGNLSCWEPACGEGDMARPLAEAFRVVTATDIHPYGFGGVRDFLDGGTLFEAPSLVRDMLISNPPFNKGADFVNRALSLKVPTVALLMRAGFCEGGKRYRMVFRADPPTDILVFAERVSLVPGRLDRAANMAASYYWYVWDAAARAARPSWARTLTHWIGSGTRARLERDADYPGGLAGGVPANVTGAAGDGRCTTFPDDDIIEHEGE